MLCINKEKHRSLLEEMKWSMEVITTQYIKTRFFFRINNYVGCVFCGPDTKKN